MLKAMWLFMALEYASVVSMHLSHRYLGAKFSITLFLGTLAACILFRSETGGMMNDLREIAGEYPGALQFPDYYLEADIARIRFQVQLITSAKGADVDVCDVGGGVGLFSVAAAQAGMRVTVIDDFGDHPDVIGNAIGILQRRGVGIISDDPLAHGFPFGPETLDVVTCFASMEHWHQSPKKLFREIRDALRPGGLFILSGPNCVNLRKRITVPLGHGKWTPLHDWYEAPVFRSHVREPDVADLRYIANDMGLRDVRIIGRNWIGYMHPSKLVRFFMPLVDPILQLRPTLCSDIYMLGTKP